jgi:hypothetical protein
MVGLRGIRQGVAAGDLLSAAAVALGNLYKEGRELVRAGFFVGICSRNGI